MYLRLKSLLYYIVLSAAIFTVLPSCTINLHRPLAILPAGSNNNFAKAKYLTELMYLTRDKELVQGYKTAYISGQTNRAEFKELNEWSEGRDKETIIETIEMFLDLEFEGR